MSDINWKPDEKGVPMCMAQLGKPCPRGRAHPDECTMDPDSGDDGMCYDGCYPQMAKMAAALQGIKDWWKDGEVSDEDLCFQQVYIVITKALEVLSP